MNTLNFINSALDIELKSNEELPFKLSNKTFKKGEVITDFGNIETKAYFLKCGIVQVSMIYNNQEERILDFIFENNFFCSYSLY